MQRRTLRRWQAYLDGAPLRGEQQGQQGQAAAGDGRQRVGTSAPGSPRAPAGGSPKRPHDDIAADAVQWGQLTAGSQLQQQEDGTEQEEERSKRSRRGAAGGEDGEGGGWEDEQRPPRGSSPTSRLSEQLQQALRSSSLPLAGADGEDGLQAVGADGAAALAGQHAQQAQQHAQQQAQQQAQQEAPAGSEAALAAALAAAVQQAVAAGLLPAAAYPAPRVQQPSAKALKVLPAGVTHTSPFPLAVAAVASKALAAGGAGGPPSKASPEEVAALLAKRLPAELAAACQAVKGHLNFRLPQLAPAGAAEHGSRQHGASVGQQQAHRCQQGHPRQQQQQQQQQQRQRQGQEARQQGGSAAAPTGGSSSDGIPRGMPRHFELRTLPSGDPFIVQTEFQLFKKYQVGASSVPAVAVEKCQVGCCQLLNSTRWAAANC